MTKKRFHLLRWLFGGGVVTLIVLVAVVLLVVNANLGTIVQKAVTTFGPKLTGTDIQVEKVRLSLVRGDLKVTNLVLGQLVSRGMNPPGVSAYMVTITSRISLSSSISTTTAMVAEMLGGRNRNHAIWSTI